MLLAAAMLCYAVGDLVDVETGDNRSFVWTIFSALVVCWFESEHEI